MYTVSRLLLLFAFLCGIYCFAIIIAMGWPATGLLVAAAVVFIFKKPDRDRQLKTLGSARWASVADLRRAQMTGPASGLILGRVLAERFRRNRVQAVRKLFSWRTSSEEVCKNFWFKSHSGTPETVRLANAVHSAVFCPTGGGKGVSFVIPFLLSRDDSCVIVDFKGENAMQTALHRSTAFGHRIVLLDPFRVVASKPDSFNPLDFIKRDDPLALDQCFDLAKALVVRTGEEKEPHWNDSAETWIAALIAVVVYHGEQGTRSLQTVRDILTKPVRLEMAIKLMCESDAWGGMLARLGGQLQHFIDKEKSSTLTSVSRHLRFLDTLAIAESTRSSSFNPADLRSGKMTIHLVLPPEHMRAQSALLRMWIGSMLRAVVSGGLQEKNKVHFILDEAGSLGHLESIDDALDKYRGYGVRLQFYFQSLGQLKTCFPNGQDQTLLSNTTQIYAGVNDMPTAEYVSSRLGDKTIIVTSGGSGRGTSRQSSDGMNHSSRSDSDNTNDNWAQQARRLLKPEEVLALHPRVAITFTPNVPPIRTWLLRYYEEPMFGGQGGPKPGLFRRGVAAFYVVTASTVLLLVFAAIALALTAKALAPAPSHNQPHSQSIRYPQPPGR